MTDDCGAGYYTDDSDTPDDTSDDKCKQCHSTCETCSGPGESDCESCSADGQVVRYDREGDTHKTVGKCFGML